MEDNVAVVYGEIIPGGMEAKADAGAEGFEELHHVRHATGRRRPGVNGSFADGELCVRDNRRLIDLEDLTEAVTRSTGSVRGIEGEGARFQWGNGCLWMFRTDEILREAVFLQSLSIKNHERSLSFF